MDLCTHTEETDIMCAGVSKELHSCKCKTCGKHLAHTPK